jgi:4-alpha-glucanotransferase
MKVQFCLRFNTKYGESIWLNGNTYELGNDLVTEAIPMTYFNHEFWIATIEFDKKNISTIQYNYLLKNKDGQLIPEWGNDREIDISTEGLKEILTVDTWNHAGEFENAFYSAPFKNILLPAADNKLKTKPLKNFTHEFKVKAPLLTKDEAICIAGNGAFFQNWSTEKPVILSGKDNWWSVKLDLSEESLPLAYKYGVYNTKEKLFVHFEDGDNRILSGNTGKKKQTVIHDGFAHLPNNTWKGAGVAIPVFSLRSKKSMGVGEFTDIKLLVDWAKKTGLKLVQILPINDTIATHTKADSYPYAAISAFAMHPIYINLESVAGKKNADKLKSLKDVQKQLNDLPVVDYEKVIKVKLQTLKDLYELSKDECFAEEDYKLFLKDNKHWLVPYAAFCYLRDKYGNSHFELWETNNIYNKEEIETLSSRGSASYEEIALHYFIQYHLHLQLKEAADYAHKNGIVLKGDIAIGIYRYGCDAWVAPELYNIDSQAGAPPDDFALKGQNWGFPTYNWKKMQGDGFAWWRQRFEQMTNYFDAFRIDHILGFFRIWSIPMNAVEGILGHFVPSIPVHIKEFGEKGLWFDYHRYCKPYITNEVISERFGIYGDKLKSEFLIANDFGSYDIAEAFDTQRKVEKHFNGLEENDENNTIKYGLYDLISNIILIEEEKGKGQQFHFRIAMDTTMSFRYLDDFTKQKLKELYINYFYERQDDFWMKEAMQKLPYLKQSTNMLICGEDLGMVPHCVPEVMQQLGFLSLEIQRMPKNPKTKFFNPKTAPYLSVVTPSTHDMSTVRGWWEEDRKSIQEFYNHEMGQWGDAPLFCEAWINRAIILQHLYSPAMWSIFQLQDILGMGEKIRRENPNDERINVPSNPNHYWQYRMHIGLEELIKQKEFNEELRGYMEHSGRNAASM